ncbi:hypothetical protein M0R72_10375 [Candidatus Pacearchaeota archaeon]|jgi:hypothetical protein|nr:hypothetical protein [Candidatus Pacearchaeota archaeon]
MKSDDKDQTELLRGIKADTAILVAMAPPKVRTWAWRLNNMVNLGTAIASTVAGAIAGAAMGYWFSKL